MCNCKATKGPKRWGQDQAELLQTWILGTKNSGGFLRCRYCVLLSKIKTVTTWEEAENHHHTICSKLPEKNKSWNPQITFPSQSCHAIGTHNLETLQLPGAELSGFSGPSCVCQNYFKRLKTLELISKNCYSLTGGIMTSENYLKLQDICSGARVFVAHWLLNSTNLTYIYIYIIKLKYSALHGTWSPLLWCHWPHSLLPKKAALFKSSSEASRNTRT